MLPDHAQVCIIGTGLSGVSTAYHLLKTDPQIKVVLLEARTLCSAASGRNGGHLTCDLYSFAPSLLKAGFTASQIRQHAHFEIDNFNALTELIQTELIPCEYARKKHLNVCLTKEEFLETMQCVESMRTCGFALPTVKVWRNPEASALAGIVCYGLVEHAYSASVNPYKLVSGIMGLMMTRYHERIQLFTETPVTKVSGNRLYTDRGTLTCTDLVFATNGYTAALLPSLSNVIVPVRGQILSRSLSKTVQNCSFAMGGEYLSQRPSGKAVLGGARRFARNMEWNNSDDSGLSSDVSAFLHRFLDRVASPASLVATREDEESEMEWSGIMGFSKLGIPSVMQLPRGPQQMADEVHGGRSFICAGFTGHGMPRIFLSAAHIARLILGQTTESAETDGVPRGYDTMHEMTQQDWTDR